MINSQLIEINENSEIPKYKQIIFEIERNIANAEFAKGDRLPSINQVSEGCFLSRDTVEKAYSNLKSRKIIKSVRGKGYYVVRTDVAKRKRLLYLLPQLNDRYTSIYQSLKDILSPEIEVELVVYESDCKRFLELLETKRHTCSDFIIALDFQNCQGGIISNYEQIWNYLDGLDRDHLLLLDHAPRRFGKKYNSFHQDYEKDIHNLLSSISKDISHYCRIELVYSLKGKKEMGFKMANGLRAYCQKENKQFNTLPATSDETLLKEGALYIVYEDSDLVNVLTKARCQGWQLGKNLGVIALNDSCLKEYNNISVIACDYEIVSSQIANFFDSENRGNAQADLRLICRGSY